MKLEAFAVILKSAKSERRHWFLHHKHPHVRVCAQDGRTYVVRPDFTTQVQVGELLLPHPHCPFPGTAILANLYLILYRMRKNIFYIAGTALVFALALILSATYLMAAHPASGEMLQNALFSGLLLFISVCFAAFAVRLIYLFYISGEQVFSDIVQDVKTAGLLTGGNRTESTPELSIIPDILVIQKPDEADADFINRVESKKISAGHGVWVLAFAFREPVATIWETPTRSIIFARDTPPFQDADTPEESRFVPTGADFTIESYEAFSLYCTAFVARYRNWAQIAKVDRAENTQRGNAWLDSIRAKTAALCAVFLISACALSAQSAAAVERAVGTAIRDIPSVGADVSYQFEKKSLNRVGNGRSNYVELLRGIPSYRDCCHGALIAVYKDGEVIAKGSAAGEVAGNKRAYAMRKEGDSAISTNDVKGFTFPDSAQSASIAYEISAQSRELSQKASEGIKPWWEMVMNAYWDWFWLLLIITVGPWIVAKTAAREGFWDIHRYTKRVVIITTGISVFLFATNLMFLAKWAGWPNWALGVAAVCLCFAGVWAYDHMNPDYNPKPGNDKDNLRRHYNNNQLRG